MKHIHRAVLCLAAGMLLSVIVSCSDTSEADSESSESVAAATQTEAVTAAAVTDPAEPEYSLKTYKIKTLDSAPMSDGDWDSIARAEIDTCVWLDDYSPYSYAQVCYVKGDGFYARMTCEEANPIARHTGFYSEVYKDSCLEFFAQWDDASDAYVHIEMNSVGASLIGIGESMATCVPVTEKLETPFVVTADVDAEQWSVTVRIPEDDLEALYGMSSEKFVSGYVIRGNFYKCGDETDIPHYVMWNPVDTPTPNFHTPECFGELVIE